MGGEKVYPESTEGFYGYVTLVFPYIETHKVRLKVSDVNFDALKILIGDAATVDSYIHIYNRWNDKKGSRTGTVTKMLEAKEKEIKSLLSKIYDDIPVSIWTQTDRDTFGRKTGAYQQPTKPGTKIGAACVLDVIPKANGLFDISGREHEDSKRSNLPDGADAMELAFAYMESPVRKVVIGETVSKVKKECFGPDDDTIRQMLYKAKGELQADVTLAGFNLVIWGRWINTKYPNLAGDWSVRYTVMISMA